mgnify:FL=1
MEKQLDADNNPYDKEMCDEDVCWYDWLDPQHNYTVYTIPGGGWLNYMTILSEINLSKFDQCIIQETFETRMFFHCDDAFRKVTRNNLEVHYGEVRPCDTVDGKSAWMHEHIIQACVTQGNHLLKQSNVPAYRFSFQGGDWLHTWIKLLPIEPVIDTLLFERGGPPGKLHNYKLDPHGFLGHLTHEGCERLGNMVKNVL